MSLLLVTVPLYSKDMVVEAYMFRYRSDASEYAAGYSPLLEVLRKAGMDALSVDRPLLIPVSAKVLLSEDFSFPSERVVLLLEEDVRPEGPYLARIDELRLAGFHFAVRGLNEEAFLNFSDYLLVDFLSANLPALRRAKRANKNLMVAACNIPTPEDHEACKGAPYDLFEGAFYSDPITEGRHEITPIKSNLIRLLNVVRDENFEFQVVAEIVRNDPALSVSLMRFINSTYLGLRHRVRTIHHAVVILGQWEVRKWVTAAVFRSIGTDRPGELTRLSLMRAKTAENLAPFFGMEAESQSLFLMGLFSVLDAILSVPMREAMTLVMVSSDIHDALVDKAGVFYPVLDFIKQYEKANWHALLGLCDKHGLQHENACNAYVQALYWYNELISENVRPHR